MIISLFTLSLPLKENESSLCHNLQSPVSARSVNVHERQIERGHGSFLTSTNHSVAAIKNNPDRPREPPPPATPLDFPCCKPRRVLRLGLDDDFGLRKTFTNILRTGPGVKHIEALNVTLTDEVSLEEIIPTDYLPSTFWKNDPGTDESANGVSIEPSQPHKLSNGAPMPGRGKFFESVKELSYDNEDAFRAIRRDPPRSGHRPPRLVHFRKFWDSLSIMAEYWDTSVDNYVEKKEDKENDRSAMDVDELRSEAQKFADEMLNKPAKTEKKMMYTGRRTDTGRNMPGNFREDTVCAFVETLSWAFRCRLEHPKMQPRVKLQGMVLPLPHTVLVYRQPQDRLHAKAGILEGPLMGVFCRDPVCFRKAEEKLGEGKTEILDLLRETGLILMLAQKRAREGKQEEIPGEGKWWAHAPRWGGGPGGEIGIAAEEETIEDVEGSSEGQRKRVKKGSKADAWRNVRPPSATWEKNIKYLQIGRDKRTEHDDVSLILLPPVTFCLQSL